MQTDGSAPKAAFHLSFTKFLSCSKFIAPVPLAINLGPVAYLMSQVLPESLANGRIDVISNLALLLLEMHTARAVPVLCRTSENPSHRRKGKKHQEF